jgi:hypothetical protein
VLNLRIIRTARRITDAVRSVVTPAALVLDQAQQDQTPTTAPDPTDLYGPDDMPAVADIERAAMQLDLACDNARRADRTKRAAKKILDKVPTGIHGRYRIFRTPSSRMTPDLAAITATYKKLGLGAVPMKACADSLKVELLAVPAADIAELVAA